MPVAATISSAVSSPATGAAAGRSPGSDTTASAAEIEALIQDLQDPERRAALIRELEALQQARSAADTPATRLTDLNVTELLARGADRIQGWWQQLLSVDAMWVMTQLAWSALALLAIAIVYLLARRGLRRLGRHLSRAATGGEPHPGVRLGERLMRIALLALAVASLLQIWGFSLLGWITALTGLAWVRNAFAVVLIVAAALTLWSLSDALIATTMNRQSNRLANARQRSRLRTVTPLIQGTLRITIGILAVLLILAQLGVNIGPLLAGAGIIGLAVGFGAQSLIKDLLIGVTLLLEDAASVGDIIDLGGTVGEVEAMGIRMIRLRDLEGTVHMIPYSEVTRVSNLTKDFAFALLDVRVAYRENVDHAIETLVDVAAGLRNDPDLGELILEDLEVMGVNALGESGVEIRIRLKTLPLERWRIARELRRRIKARFDDDGIEIPYPHRILYFGEDRSGRAAPLRLAEAADVGEHG